MDDRVLESRSGLCLHVASSRFGRMQESRAGERRHDRPKPTSCQTERHGQGTRISLMPSRVHRLNAGTAATRKESAFRPRPWLSQILVDREETHLVAVTPMVSNGLHFRNDTGSCREDLMKNDTNEESHQCEPVGVELIARLSALLSDLSCVSL